MPSPRKTESKIRVLCVDDHPDVITTMKMVIDAEPDMICVGGVSSADNLLDDVRRTRAEIVLLDKRMSGKDSIQAQRGLAMVRPGGSNGARCTAGQVRTIIFSGHHSLASVGAAIEAGAWGYLCKDQDIQEVLDTIRQVAKGKLVFAEHR